MAEVGHGHADEFIGHLKMSVPMIEPRSGNLRAGQNDRIDERDIEAVPAQAISQLLDGFPGVLPEGNFGYRVEDFRRRKSASERVPAKSSTFMTGKMTRRSSSRIFSRRDFAAGS